ncbi:hypothetical protein [Streptomyces sp. NPDC005423]|uniref:hypothetical protein n=1 Tax=Streptomyces sp. NPDC005423 TaxID=3155343 RepID=UPI0033A070E3
MPEADNLYDDSYDSRSPSPSSRLREESPQPDSYQEGMVNQPTSSAFPPRHDWLSDTRGDGQSITSQDAYVDQADNYNRHSQRSGTSQDAYVNQADNYNRHSQRSGTSQDAYVDQADNYDRRGQRSGTSQDAYVNHADDFDRRSQKSAHTDASHDKDQQPEKGKERKGGWLRRTARQVGDLASKAIKWAKSPQGKKILGATLAVAGLVTAVGLAASGLGAGIGVGMMLGGGALYANGRRAQKREDAAKWQAEQPMSSGPYAGMPAPQQAPMQRQEGLTVRLGRDNSIELQMGQQRVTLVTAQPTQGEDRRFVATSPITPEAYQHMTAPDHVPSRQSAGDHDFSRAPSPHSVQQPAARHGR